MPGAPWPTAQRPRGRRSDPIPAALGAFTGGLDRLEIGGSPFMGLEDRFEAPPRRPGPPGLADPLPLPAHRGPEHVYKTFRGPLFAGRVEARGVEQGAVADCFVAAALASVADARPKAVRDAFKEVGAGPDGRRFFEVSLFEPDGGRRVWPVDDDLLVDRTGRPVYGRWPAEGPEELWFPLLEKVFMALLNEREGADEGYLAGSRGGSAFVVFEAVLGAAPQNYRLAQHAHQPEAVVDLILRAVELHEPMVAYTYEKQRAHLYEGTGLIPWHTYSVLGVEHRDGVAFVQLYNPWSKGEPAGDGQDDGFFTLEMQEFLRLFRNMNIGHDPQV